MGGWVRSRIVGMSLAGLLVIGLVVRPAHPAATRVIDAPGSATCVRDFPSDIRFVSLAYQVVLERDASFGEAASWARRFGLPSSLSYSDLVTGLLASSEHRRHLVIDEFRSMLGREPDAAGLSFWAEWLRTHSPATFAAQLLASDEHVAAAGGTDSDWVSELYRQVLKRDVDSASLRYWLGIASSGHQGRLMVAGAIWQSAENRDQRIATMYQAIFGRVVDSAGQRYWSDQLARTSDNVVTARLIATQEFWSRSQRSYGAPATAMPPPCPRLPLIGRTIVIDPGHNGGNAAHPEIINALVPAGGFMKACDTTGTQTNAGYPEHAFTWDVAVRLAALLRGAGATVVLTRPDDGGVGPCVNQRAEAGNRAKANLAISIHADGGPDWGRGFHVLTPAGGSGSDPAIVAPSARFGTMLRDRFGATGMPVSNYAGSGGIMIRSDLGGLNLSHVPKVFIECGNMRNVSDAALLTNASFRASAAKAIDASIVAYLGA